MATANGVRNRVQNTQQKEEKMNARKVVCVVCVLVVGLLLVLESPVLAGPPGAPLYWLGERPVYGPSGGPVAPRVSVPLYRAEDSKPPSWYRGWGGGYQAAPNPLYGYPPGNKVAPKVPVPLYRYPGAGPQWRR